MGSHTLQQLKKLSFDEVKELFKTTMKRVNTFTPIESDDTALKVIARSSKRDTEQELNQESSKRQKIGEGLEPAEESIDELSQEQLQQLMIIVPEEGINVEALQTKCPIIDWEVYTKDSRKDDLVKLWSLVHERFNSIEPTKDKERELWIELKRLFKPDDNDILWKLQSVISFRQVAIPLLRILSLLLFPPRLLLLKEEILYGKRLRLFYVPLLKVLKSHKWAIAWKISDIKGINPSFCTHKILMGDDFKPAVQHQRRVIPKIREVIKKEVIKLLDAGLIYPISDSPWVSPVHCVPKKGGMTVVENEDNELIPTRHVPKVHDGYFPRHDRGNNGGLHGRFLGL
ncbi:hypothetical protein Tco_1507130 [Tanacetum coccineum]